jgi:hypothetical protein
MFQIPPSKSLSHFVNAPNIKSLFFINKKIFYIQTSCRAGGSSSDMTSKKHPTKSKHSKAADQADLARGELPYISQEELATSPTISPGELSAISICLRLMHRTGKPSDFFPEAVELFEEAFKFAAV